MPGVWEAHSQRPEQTASLANSMQRHTSRRAYLHQYKELAFVIPSMLNRDLHRSVRYLVRSDMPLQGEPPAETSRRCISGGMSE